MFRTISFYFLSFFLIHNINAQQYGSFKDSRDGKVYKTVKIGMQEWMAENLNVDQFLNGDLIPEAKSEIEWDNAAKNGLPVWCYYYNDSQYGIKYGKLYNWYAVTDPRGLAPKGWHIPLDDEWTVLTSYLGGDDAAGDKLKSKFGWQENVQLADSTKNELINGNGNNSSGFSALPGGIRYAADKFLYLKEDGYWWSATDQGAAVTDDDPNLVAWARVLGSTFEHMYRSYSNYKGIGMSVRCIKNPISL
jgi:uncharacterized protein (TIGR02145 family)